MTDHELDRVLAAAVNAEHSADFVARVRSRVAQEPRPRWFFPWRWATAGAALTAMLVGAIGGWPDGNTGVRPPAPVVATRATAVEPAAAPSPVPPVPSALVATDGAPRTVRPRQAPGVTSRRPTAPRFPEVLIAEEDAEAIRLLAVLATAGRLPAHLETDGVSTRDAVTLPRIEVPPIVVEPLAGIARPEGDPQ